MYAYELVPIALGLVIGLAASRFVTPRGRFPTIVGLSLATGLAVSAAAGELEVSWTFFLWDVGQVLGSAVIVLLVVNAVRGRRSMQSS